MPGCSIRTRSTRVGFVRSRSTWRVIPVKEKGETGQRRPYGFSSGVRSLISRLGSDPPEEHSSCIGRNSQDKGPESEIHRNFANSFARITVKSRVISTTKRLEWEMSLGDSKFLTPST